MKRYAILDRPQADEKKELHASTSVRSFDELRTDRELVKG